VRFVSAARTSGLVAGLVAGVLVAACASPRAGQAGIDIREQESTSTLPSRRSALQVPTAEATTGTSAPAPTSSTSSDVGRIGPTTASAQAGRVTTTTVVPLVTITPLPADVRSRMIDSSWHAGCPVSLDDLRLLQLPYRDLSNQTQRGQLVVRADQAQAVANVFVQLFTIGFPIERMQLVDAYGGSDDASMAADNTSAFNCRPVQGTTTWSQHAYGLAVDINPRLNPWLHAGRIDPPNGAAYADRSLQLPGMIHDGDAVVMAFAAIGWPWGGNDRTTKDYQHFSLTGK
jgi:poly-gamma-glutamate synthesis protein (capsule biosynthesis protein)